MISFHRFYKQITTTTWFLVKQTYVNSRYSRRIRSTYIFSLVPSMKVCDAESCKWRMSIIYCCKLKSLSLNPSHFYRFYLQIGTHDGVFHCDEVMACYMLKLLPQYKDASVVRTREIKKLDDCEIVVDVGSVFDHEKRRYDHHQREFTETLSSLRPELGEKYKIRLVNLFVT